MKRLIALLLTLAMVLALCACGKDPVETEPATEAAVETTEAAVETTEAAEEATTEATEATEAVEETTEPEPVYTNPLSGVVVDEPMTSRPFVVTINNLEDALPHYSVNDADIYMEMFVNGSIIRGLAMFSDVSKVDTIGSVRSVRMMFNDIASHYDAIIAHAGGSSQVLSQTNSMNLDHFNIDTWDETYYSFRDMDRKSAGYSWEHCLFAKGAGLVEYAKEQGIEVTRDADKDYGLTFTEDGTPADGEVAETITVTFSYGGSRKDTTMQYDADLGKYVYYQYGKMMVDGATNAPEAFENVVVMMTNISLNGMYHEADFVAGGEGYFACGGKLIPIKWHCDSEESPFCFTTVDGEPLDFGVGNTYIAIAPVGSPVVYGALDA